MNFSIEQVFKNGAVVQSSKTHYGVAAIHVETLGKMLPQIANGAIEAVKVVDVRYVNGKPNELALMLGIQEMLEGEAKVYDCGLLDSFEEGGEPEQVYLLAIDEGDGNTALTFSLEVADIDLEEGVFSSFSVQTDEMEEVGNLLAETALACAVATKNQHDDEAEA